MEPPVMKKNWQRLKITITFEHFEQNTNLYEGFNSFLDGVLLKVKF